jgi:hypothetical protein
MRDEADSVSCPTVSFAISCVLQVSEDKQNIKQECTDMRIHSKCSAVHIAAECSPYCCISDLSAVDRVETGVSASGRHYSSEVGRRSSPLEHTDTT